MRDVARLVGVGADTECDAYAGICEYAAGFKTRIDLIEIFGQVGGAIDNHRDVRGGKFRCEHPRFGTAHDDRAQAKFLCQFEDDLDVAGAIGVENHRTVTRQDADQRIQVGTAD